MPRASDPIRALARLIPSATRAALEETFWYWLHNIAPEHFRRAAFGNYDEYAESRKRDEAEWRRRHPREVKSGLSRDVAPLKSSGRLERAFLHGSVMFSAGNKKLTARWPGLPDYVRYWNRYSGFQPSRAITAVSERDQASLERLFREWLNRNLTTGDIADKTFGQAVLQTTGD